MSFERAEQKLDQAIAMLNGGHDGVRAQMCSFRQEARRNHNQILAAILAMFFSIAAGIFWVAWRMYV